MPNRRNSDMITLLSPFFLRREETGLAWMNVRAAGATGDGSTDDTAAIQAAVDTVNGAGGGTVYVPRGTYITSGAILIKSNVSLVGSGMDTLIHNSANNGDYRDATIFMGNHNPGFNDDYTAYALDAITRGSTTVTTSTAADASNFSAGDMAFIRDSNYDSAVPARRKPLYQETARVVSADGGTGDIVLDHGIGEGILSPEIVVVDGEATQNGLTSYICDRGEVRNLRVKSSNSSWIMRVACYESVVDNVFVEESVSLLIGNSFARSRFSNIAGYFHQRGIEIKTGAHDSLFENITGFWLDDNTDTSSDHIVNVGGEANRRLKFVNGMFFLPGRSSGADLISVSPSKYIEIENCYIYAPDETGPGVFVRSPFNGGDANQHIFIRANIVGGGLSAVVRIGASPTSNTFTVDTGTDVFTASGHGMADGWTVQVSSTGTLPSPLAAATDYYVINSTTNTFQLALTQGGSAINVTTTGSGTHTVDSNLPTPSDIDVRVKADCTSGGINVLDGANYDIEAWTSHDEQVSRESSVFFGYGAEGIIFANNEGVVGKETDDTEIQMLRMGAGDHIQLGEQAQAGDVRISAAGVANAVIVAGTSGQVQLSANEPLRFNGTMGNSTKDPTADAPSDWVQVKIGGTTYYLPAYAA